MKLHFKFREGLDNGLRLRFIQTLKNHGAQGVRRLFPKETDGELATMYTVEVSRMAVARKVLDFLRSADSVEFAESELRRKLIQPMQQSTTNGAVKDRRRDGAP